MPKEKNSGRLRDLGREQTGPRQLDHGADLIGDLGVGVLHHRLRGGVDARLDEVELHLGRDQRHHHLEADGLAGALLGLDGGFEDRTRLHLGDLRIGDRDAAAAEAEHRIELRQLARTVGQTPRIGVHGARHFLDLGMGVRQELVQRRIEQTDRDGQALHDLEQLDEVGALHRQQFCQRGAARLLVLGEIISRTVRMRVSSKNMCSVRHRPMPSAPNLIAVRASSGVSPLTRTPILRT